MGDYKFKDQCALSAKIVNANSALTANVSGVTFRGDWALGASVSGKLNDKPKPKISFGAQYNRGCYVATLLTHKSDTVESQFSFIRRTDTHSFGGNFKANYCTGATAAAIAVSCDSCGCGTSTKFVVSTDNTIGVAWKRNLILIQLYLLVLREILPPRNILLVSMLTLMFNLIFQFSTFFVFIYNKHYFIFHLQ